MPTANEIAMLRAARAAGVTSRYELANLMAQVSHESSGLTRLEEGFRYTRGLDQVSSKVPSVLREGREAAEAARLEALDGRPQELARLMYGGRMGNDDVGDGYLYRGRGFIQLTGEDNYRAYGTALNLDLVGNPDLAATPDNASRIALSYWQTAVPQADRDDVTAAAIAINGRRVNGLPDRHNRFDAWYAVLTPEFIAGLDAGRILPGNGVAPAIGQDAMADGALRRLETGPDVRQLQDDLHTLGVRGERSHEVRTTGSFGSDTEEAVRHFQGAHGLPVTGRASPETLNSVRDALQQRHRQQLPENPAVPHMGPPGDRPRIDEEQEVPNHRPHRDDHVHSFQTNHRDYALYEAIRRQLPADVSDEMAAHVTLQAKIDGITRVSELDEVIIQDGTAFVGGKTPGDLAIVDLSVPVPPLQDTLQQSAAFDQKQSLQLAEFQEQQRQINLNGGGPTMTL